MKSVAVAAAVLIVGAGAWLAWRWNATPSVHDLPDTHYVAPRDWQYFYGDHLPRGTGWVLLPAPTDATAFADDRGRDEIVTPDVCGECHEGNYSRWLTTAHAVTSREATLESVAGSFEGPGRRLETQDADLSFEMTATRAGLFQTAQVRHESRIHTHSERFDIVVGSGQQGQTYLYWLGDHLHQLPVSYFTGLDRWINSPGVFVDGAADFARPIEERCLDCHATWFARAPGSRNRYDRTNYVLGVTCVRCHGPGRRHVEYHRANPEATVGEYIVQPIELERGRTNVICAQCHSGSGRLLKPAFTYRPGEPIEEYVKLDFEEYLGTNDDPHAANQLARLRRSRCYRADASLSCVSCHDPHRLERGDLKRFAERCMQCHEPEVCELAARVGPQIRDHCISCHMPLRSDEKVTMQADGGRVLPQLRDHYVKGWPEATRRVLESLGK